VEGKVLDVKGKLSSTRSASSGGHRSVGETKNLRWSVAILLSRGEDLTIPRGKRDHSLPLFGKGSRRSGRREEKLSEALGRGGRGDHLCFLLRQCRSAGKRDRLTPDAGGERLRRGKKERGKGRRKCMRRKKHASLRAAWRLGERESAVRSSMSSDGGAGVASIQGDGGNKQRRAIFWGEEFIDESILSSVEGSFSEECQGEKTRAKRPLSLPREGAVFKHAREEQERLWGYLS